MSDLVERLEPCPFCAGIADDTHAGVAPELHEDSHTNIYVWCPNCGAKGLVVVGAHGGTRQEAIAAWHRRAESPELTRLRSEVERLTRERDEARSEREGWVLAPIEPTKAMKEAGMSPFLASHDPFFSQNEPCGPIYAAMLRARPTSTSAPANTLFNKLKEKDNGQLG